MHVPDECVFACLHQLCVCVCVCMHAPCMCVCVVLIANAMFYDIPLFLSPPGAGILPTPFSMLAAAAADPKVEEASPRKKPRKQLL